MNRGGRPRTVEPSARLPVGMRRVDGKWYWRGTTKETREIAAKLKATGLSMNCGDTPAKARAWWNKHVKPMLQAQA